MKLTAGLLRGKYDEKKVITYGTFDLFHEGHYNILKKSESIGRLSDRGRDQRELRY